MKITGLENVPQHLPILFASNHQNTFLDAVLVAFSIKRNVYFMVRSDLFKKGIITKLFKALFLIPIHRSDKYEQGFKEKNSKIFKLCQSYLEKKEPILIFPEGNSNAAYRLSSLKKGVSRLAFQCEVENNFKLDLQIVPVAINYENHFLARKTVWIDYLESISVAEFKDAYIANNANAIQQLNKKIKTELESAVLVDENIKHVQDFLAFYGERYPSGKKLVEVYKNEPVIKTKISKKKKLIRKLLSILFFPTFFITQLILRKVNDMDFTLSIKSFSWLIFGGLQTIVLLLTLIIFFNIQFGLVIVGTFSLLSIILIKLS